MTSEPGGRRDDWTSISDGAGMTKEKLKDYPTAINARRPLRLPPVKGKKKAPTGGPQDAA